MGHVNEGGVARSVALGSNGFVFLANEEKGLYAYQYDGTSFRKTGQINDGGEAMSVTVSPEGIVYLANGSDGLRAYQFDGSTFINSGHIFNGIVNDRF